MLVYGVKLDFLCAKVELDKITQENAKIASATHLVAQQASDIAQKIVNDAKGKAFDGKEQRKIEKCLKIERKGTKADGKH